MNTSQFMDKQIMDLSQGSSHNGKDFIDLMNHPHDEDQHRHHSNNSGGGFIEDNGIKKEEIVPSYDFQPIRPISTNLDVAASLGGSTSRASITNSSTTTAAPPLRNYGSLDTIDPTKVILEKDRNAFDTMLVSEVDRMMKKYSDNLLLVLEGVSARLTQLESRTRHLENSVDDLKVSVGNNHGSTDGKMRQLENIMREVQTGVRVLKDKQEIVEAQLQLAKLQVSKVDPQAETQNAGNVDSVQQAASAPPQSHPQLHPVTFPQTIPSLPVSAALPQQNPPPPSQLLNPFPQNQIPSVPQREPYFPPPGQAPEAPAPLYQAPAAPQPQPSHVAPPHQPYPPAPQPQYSQPPQPPQLQPSLSQHPEEPPYIPSQNYPPNLRQPPSQPPAGPPPSQQYYGVPSHSYEPTSSRPNSGFSTGYGTPSGPSEPYPYGGPPSQFNSSSTMKPQQLSSAMAQSGGSGYPQLPTARILPQALPTASGVGGGSGSAGTGNRVPIDDVVDKVTSMGFPRDHVRATVRKLTENGQAVDLNIVLDKLMNDGEVQPPRGWFSR